MATSRIFVKGLPPSISEAEFRRHFSAKDREITDVKLIPQRRIGYVGYKSPEDASKAVKYFNKSYIRMSKISVESARPISDPASSQVRSTGRNVGGPAVHKAPRSPDDKDLDSRKRKRDETDQSDPKLQEFIRVMETARERVIADDTNLATQALPAEPSKATAAEGDSDDEYEQIPARSEKHRRIHAPETRKDEAGDELSKVRGGQPSAHPSVSEATEAPTDPPNADGGETVNEPTDDDWLRSRTNRLLDLVDPDEIEPPQAAVPENGSAQRDIEDGDEPAQSGDEATDDVEMGDPAAGKSGQDTAADTIRRTSRLFVRNLPYSATEDEVREAFGEFGTLQEVHLPVNNTGNSKGFALVLFADPSDAVTAFQAMDGAAFQGRIVHIIPANARRDVGLDEFEISKLPLRKQNTIRRKAEAASSTFNWNSLYMNQDAVNTSVAKRLNVSKSELLDPTSADAAVNQAIAETTVIQETKAYFAANDVDLDSFKSHKRGETAILVKNFPYGTTMEELRALFEESGPVLRVLMPPSGTIAIVEFSQANHAKTAFGKLAYRRIKDSVLFLEKAPRDVFRSGAAEHATQPENRPTGIQKLSVSELLSRGDKADEEANTASLFVRNLNFTTTTSRLAEAFESLDGFVSARVKTKMDPKKPGQTLSMGFGFVEFRTKEQAQAGLQVMDGYLLEGHTLAVKASHRGLDAAEERRREDNARKAGAQRTKIVIKNLPFQATKKEVRALFGTYGQLRSVRVPKKADYTTRGFAFADFVTSREAENALNALRDTHLLGRRLVLDFAEAEAVDAEEEIAKMQRKVGGQVNKVALQKLTGGGRRRVNIGEDGDDQEAGKG